MYSSVYHFTLAKVVPDIERSGWSRRGALPARGQAPGYTRLPGQETTVSATRLRCSFSMGTSAEWLIPAVDRPFTATIMSPHLRRHKSGSETLRGDLERLNGGSVFALWCLV